MPPLPPPFIASHRLKRLMLSDDQRSRAREILRKGRDERLVPGVSSTHRDADLWKLEDRFKFFQSLKYRRIAVTVDGGFGKSIALRQLQFVRQHFHLQHLVLKFDLADLPEQPEQYFDSGEVNLFLARWVNRYMRTPLEAGGLSFASSNISVDVLGGWLRSLSDRGNLTLMVDGLDQAERISGAKRMIALKAVLEWNPEVHCVVAGRPSAIEEYWNLFSSDPGFGSDWEFLMIPDFDADEIRQFIGTERYNHLKTLDATALFVPRTLDLVRRLPDAEFAQCQSAADVYYKSVRDILPPDTEKQRTAGWHDYNGSRVLDLFSAIAYVLLMWEGGPISQITSIEQYDQLKKKLLDCFPDEKKLTVDDIDKKLQKLGTINAQWIDFSFWDHHEVNSLRWRNSTLRDFLSAVWLLKSPTKQQLEEFGKRQTIIANRSDEQYKELLSTWTFVCQFPFEDLALDYKTETPTLNYQRLIRQLFERRSHSRPTQLMFLAWPGLLRRSGFLDGDTADEAKVLKATQKAQAWARDGRQGDQTEVRQLVAPFLNEYLECKQTGDPEIAMFEASFVEAQSVPVKTIPTGQFLFGANAEEKTIDSSFKLSAYQVWNALYDRFDGNHRKRNSDYGKYSPYERDAAIYKTWYDAWIFAIWSHGYLPNEFEWEAACRGRVGDLDRNHHRSWLTETNVVGHQEPNAYGLHDVHSHVYEWTNSWFYGSSRGRGERCMRGGLTDYEYGPPDVNGCGGREYQEPTQATRRNGLRVARAFQFHQL